jgi:hypothetical protein
MACIYGHVSIAENGERAAWGSAFGAATLVDDATATDVHSAMLHDPAASLGVHFAWSESELIVASDYGPVQVWNATNGHHIATILSSVGGEVDLCWTPDGKSIVVATGAGSLEMAETGSGWRPARLVQPPEPETLGPRPEVVATDSHIGLRSGGSVRVVARSGETLFSRELGNRWSSQSGHTMAFSRGGDQFAFLDGTQLTVLTLGAASVRLNWAREYLEAAEPRILGWGRDGRLWLLTGRHTLTIADRASETILRADGAIDDGTMSADGRTVALAIHGLTLIDTETAAATSIRFLVAEDLAVAQIAGGPPILTVATPPASVLPRA